VIEDEDCDDEDDCTRDYCDPDFGCRHVDICEDDDDPPLVDCCEGEVADSNPVYYHSGEKVESVTDIKIKGRGFDFAFVRTYRSRAERETVLGHNWDHSYNVYLEHVGDDLHMYLGGHRRDVFYPNPEDEDCLNSPSTCTEFIRGEYFAKLTIETSPSNHFKFTRSDGSIWYFHPFDSNPEEGKIDKIVDRNGNEMSFTYDTNGEIDKITDTLDREIDFTYTNGKLASITDFASRAVSYNYYPACNTGPCDGDLNDLESVTYPAVTGWTNGKTWTYTYAVQTSMSDLDHNLLTITDGKGQTYKQIWYGDLEGFPEVHDRVVQQQVGGGMISYVYNELTSPTEAPDAVWSVTINDRVGNVEQRYYDHRHRMVLKREYTGRAPNPAIATEFPSTNIPGSPLRSGDPSYFDTVKVWDENSQLLKITYPNGDVMENVVDSENTDIFKRGNVTERTRKYTDSQSTVHTITEEFEYNHSFSGGGGCGCGSDFMTLYEDGEGNVTTYEYDAKGNRTKINHPTTTSGPPNMSSQTIVEEFTYNTYGQIETHAHPTSDDGGTPSNRVDRSTYYDSGTMEGYLKEHIVAYDSGSGQTADRNLTTTFEYDSVGNVTKVSDPKGNFTAFVVNDLDQITKKTTREGYEVDYLYDGNNNLVQIDVENVDPNDPTPTNAYFTTVLEYDLLNNLTQVCREEGAFTGTIPGTSQLPECTGLESTFVNTVYEYDGNENRTLTKLGLAAEATSGDNTNNTVTNSYDERDLPYQVIRADGHADESTTQFNYDGKGRLTQRVVGLEAAPDEHVYEYVYDGFDRVIFERHPEDVFRSYDYDKNNNLIREMVCTDESSAACELNSALRDVTYSYDEMDRRYKADFAFFDDEGTNLTGTPGASSGHILKFIRYDAASQIVGYIDGKGEETSVAYDLAHRPVRITDPLNNEVNRVYDKNSNVVEVHEVDKTTGLSDQTMYTYFEYDDENRVTRSERTDHVTVGSRTIRQVQEKLYDSRDNVVKEIDALRPDPSSDPGNVVTYKYDGLNRLLETKRIQTDDGTGTGTVTGNIATTQVWDDSWRLVSRSDDSGNVTSYDYDPLNRLTQETMADGTSRSFELDVFGNPIVIDDANGSTITNTFDDLNRLRVRSVNPGTGIVGETLESYSYDKLSRLVHTANQDTLTVNSIVTRKYDSMSNIIEETQKFASYDAETVTATHDAEGNMLTCTYPGGREVKFDFDELDRKSRIFEGSGPEVDIATYAYRGPHLVHQRAYPKTTASYAVQSDFSYDGIRRMIGLTHNRNPSGTPVELDELSFSWDLMNNKTNRTRNLPGYSVALHTHDYTYDSVYRMIASDFAVGMGTPATKTYNLDDVGNRTSTTGTGGGSYHMASTNPPKDEQMNQYTRTHMSHREYDSNGNLTEIAIMGDADGDGEVDLTDFGAFQSCYMGSGVPVGGECNVFDFDDDGDVDLVDYGQFELLYGTQPAAQIAYDFRNQMATYSEWIDGSVDKVHEYYYDTLGRRIAKIVDAGGTPEETRYYYVGWRVVEEQDDNGDTLATYVYGNYIDEVLQMRRDVDGTGGPEDYYYLHDDMHNVMALTDATGTVVERYQYDDYGQPTYTDGSFAPLGSAASAYDNPYLFTGRRFDNETGWYYYRTRYLDPFTGRFTTRDTIGIWGDPNNIGNAYAYVGNNPWTWLDPYGYETQTVGTYVSNDRENGFFNSLVEHVTSDADRVASGSELLETLDQSSGGDDAIGTWVHAQHGWVPNSTYGNNVDGGLGGGQQGSGTGFYGSDPPDGSDPGGKSLDDLSKLIESGAIKFKDDCSIYLYGCEVSNTGDFAKRLSKITGCKVYAASGKCSTAHSDGSPGTATDPWRAEGGWDEYEDGNRDNDERGPTYLTPRAGD
jgi:RHS repeat-associated protein